MSVRDTEPTYLAQPPSTCCFVGKIHDGEPRGTVEDVQGVPTYIARPDNSVANGNIVLYFPDVWGLSNNAKLLMDGFAAGGYLTLGIDYFRGVRLEAYRRIPSANTESGRIPSPSIGGQTAPCRRDSTTQPGEPSTLPLLQRTYRSGQWPCARSLATTRPIMPVRATVSERHSSAVCWQGIWYPPARSRTRPC